MITQIQDVVMKSSAVYFDEYLKMCLLFMKYTLVYDFEWFCKTVRLVEEAYCIKVPIHLQNQNFAFFHVGRHKICSNEQKIQKGNAAIHGESLGCKLLSSY
jgi:hypothetical protein